MRYYIYTYFEGDTPIYIGVGCGRRDISHLCVAAKGCPYFHKKLRKMQREGLKPNIHHLLDDLMFQESRKWERFFIQAIGRKNLDTGPLYNLTDGGEGTENAIVSENTRQKHSTILKAAFTRPETRKQYLDALARPETRYKVAKALQTVRRHQSSRRESQFKGVYPQGKKWVAKIDHKHLGTFETPEQAAQAYNAGVDKYWGGNGWKNVVS